MASSRASTPRLQDASVGLCVKHDSLPCPFAHVHRLRRLLTIHHIECTLGTIRARTDDSVASCRTHLLMIDFSFCAVEAICDANLLEVQGENIWIICAITQVRERRPTRHIISPHLCRVRHEQEGESPKDPCMSLNCELQLQ